MCSNEHSSYKSVLPSQKIRKLLLNQQILSDTKFENEQVQPSSMDLRLGPKAWRMRASFLPGIKRTVNSCISEFAMQEIDLSNGYILEKGSVYLIELKESLNLPDNIEGFANAKSSTGRLDLFTRLISDYCTEFDRVIKVIKDHCMLKLHPTRFKYLQKKILN